MYHEYYNFTQSINVIPLYTVASLNSRPGGKTGAAAWFESGKFLLYGGLTVGWSGATDDLWSFRISSRKWTLLSMYNQTVSVRSNPEARPMTLQKLVGWVGVESKYYMSVPDLSSLIAIQ